MLKILLDIKMKKVLLIGCFCILSACATIVNDPNTPVALSFSDGSDGTCTMTNKRGSRTTLDVIQSNSLLLAAKISLAESERNNLIAQYNVLKAIGLLNSEYLKLK